MTDEIEKLDQVAAQCRVVVHLATAIAELYQDQADLFSSHHRGHAVLADMLGQRTADLMEFLGNHLSNIDAVTEDDEWTEPVYVAAHKMFPHKPEPSNG